VLALFIVVSALVLTTLATALADSHPAAADGQRLEDQSAEVQALYRAVYGDDAEARWIAEHNAAIGASMMGDDMMMGDSMEPTSNMYYDRIVAVAMARGADAELANRIAVDVINRGTEAAFLAGTDAGVLYGIGRSEDDINAPAPAPAAAPAASSSDDGGSTAAPSAITDWNDVSVRYLIGQTVSLTLPESDHAGVDGYALAGTPPAGLTFDAETRTVSGIPTMDNSAAPFTGNYSAQDGATDVGEPFILALTITVRTADTAPSFPDGASIDAVSIVLTEDVPTATLPTAIGGNAVVYSLDGEPAGTTLTGQEIGGTPTETGEFEVTYTAKDEDDESASLTFTITVAEDIDPVAPAIDNMTFEEGTVLGVRLPEGTGGNGALTYATTGHVALDLTFNVTTRWLSGILPTLDDGVNSITRTITYTVSDSFPSTPDTDEVMFTITVTASE
jgi:hypothetical protein